MKCKICNDKAVMNGFCSKHYVEWFENQVFKTIKDYQLLSPDEKIAVAVSGGKDSKSLLYILSKKFNVTAIAIDEGIPGYRDVLLEGLRQFCKDLGVKLKVYSFKQEFGLTLREIVDSRKFKNSGLKPCSVCGVFRRYLLNKHAKSFDKLATAHNLDDEVQTVIMNVFKNNKDLLLRIGPITSKKKGFVQRAKPFYFLKEKQVAAYAFLKGFLPRFNECPFSYGLRSNVARLVNNLEVKMPGFKKNFIQAFLKIKQLAAKQGFESFNNVCKVCGEPSSKPVCKTCELVLRFNPGFKQLLKV